MEARRRHEAVAGWLVFLAVAVIGLAIVKWMPYWHKAETAAATQSIGASILTGGADAPPAPSWQAAIGYSIAYAKAIWRAMLLGLLLGSAVQALLPARTVLRWLGRQRPGGVLRGAVLAIPGMMCTCCAAPLVVGLRRARASAGAAVSFWLGNTMLNPATLVFTGFVLGWRWSALRLVVGIATVLGLGLLANRLASPADEDEADQRLAAIDEEPSTANPFVRWMTVFAGMSVRLIPEYVVLVLLLGAARAWLFPHAGPEIAGLGWMLALAVAGTLFVIPTAGEVPIVQAMLALGVGAGPVGVLLTVLPPVSAPSIAMVASAFRPRLLAAVTLGVAAAGLVAGLAAVALRF